MRFRKLFILVLTVAAGVVVAPARATGNIVPVTTTADEYDSVPNSTCSLREAITSVNSGAAFGGCPVGATGDTILLAEGQIYQLAVTNLITDTNENANLRGDLDIGASVTVMAASGSATIDAAGLDRVLDVVTGTLLLTRVNLTNGVAPASGAGGGALQVRLGQGAILDAVVVISNSAGSNPVGGGIANSGSLTMTNSMLLLNAATFPGGGIYNAGTARVQDSAVVSNTALFGGGGIWHEAGALQLVNVTLSGNSTDGGGGGLYSNAAGVTLNNVTVARNSTGDNGGGIAGTIITSVNSIIADNSDQSGNTAPDCATTLLSLGYNFVGVTSDCLMIGDLTGVISNTTAQLGPLGNNGGPALSHTLLAGSPAANAGNPNPANGLGANCQPWDQRGYARQGSRCDIGAVESDGLLFVYLPLIHR